MAEEERLSGTGERGRRRDEQASAEAERLIAAGARLICRSVELLDRGDGVRFELMRDGASTPAFAIRHNGRVYAYLNRCGHIAMELDWTPGKFFDADGEYLICSTHGALYAPESGACRGGPCRGAKLPGVEVFESGGNVYMKMEG